MRVQKQIDHSSWILSSKYKEILIEQYLLATVAIKF